MFGRVLLERLFGDENAVSRELAFALSRRLGRRNRDMGEGFKEEMQKDSDAFREWLLKDLPGEEPLPSMGLQMAQPSDRLRKAIGAGDVLALFPLLKDWSTEELAALIEDVDEFALASNEAIDKAWKTVVFQSPAFFDKAVSRDLDQLRDEKKKLVLFAMS